jgi:hypothetical protein
LDLLELLFDLFDLSVKTDFIVFDDFDDFKVLLHDLISFDLLLLLSFFFASSHFVYLYSLLPFPPSPTEFFGSGFFSWH